MKQLTALLLTLYLIAFATSCKKDGDNDWTPPRTGDYFTCLVNGERFETEGSFSCSSKTFYYYPDGTTGLDDSYLVFSGKNCESGHSVILRFLSVHPFEGTINFLAPVQADSCSPMYRVSSQLKYETLISGNMIVTEFSPREDGQSEFGNFEGTFEFSVKNDTIDTVINITDGQFRYAVPNIW
jgi:hypothetical protein